jgi:hypothetical protein
VTFKFEIPLAAACVVAVICLALFGLLKKQKRVLQWMIISLLFASDLALLIASCTSSVPVDMADSTFFVYLDVSKLDFAVALIHLVSSFCFVCAFLVLLHLWVLVVHNELYSGRSTINVNLVSAIALICFAGVVLGIEIYLAVSADYAIASLHDATEKALAPHLMLFAVQGVVTMVLLFYYCVGFWFLRTNSSVDPTHSVRNLLIAHAFAIFFVLMLSATAIGFIVMAFPWSPIEMNGWMLVLVLRTLPMLVQTAALLVVVFLS